MSNTGLIQRRSELRNDPPSFYSLFVFKNSSATHADVQCAENRNHTKILMIKAPISTVVKLRGHLLPARRVGSSNQDREGERVSGKKELFYRAEVYDKSHLYAVIMGPSLFNLYSLSKNKVQSSNIGFKLQTLKCVALFIASP